MRKCPFCAEEIQDEAVKCRYCGSDLVDAVGVSAPSASSAPGSKKKIVALIVGILVVVIAAFSLSVITRNRDCVDEAASGSQAAYDHMNAAGEANSHGDFAMAGAELHASAEGLRNEAAATADYPEISEHFAAAARHLDISADAYGAGNGALGTEELSASSDELSLANQAIAAAQESGDYVPC